MNSKIYIDKGKPVAAVHCEILSDGSKAWNLYLGRGNDADEIPCRTEREADAALRMIAAALKIATGEAPLIL